MAPMAPMAPMALMRDRVSRGLRHGTRSALVRTGRAASGWLAARHPDLWAEILGAAPPPEVPEPTSDRVFVEELYERLLGRPAEATGLEQYIRLLAAGISRADVVVSLATSHEFRLRVSGGTASSPPRTGPLHRRPELYRYLPEQSVLTVNVEGQGDFDWLEAAITADGYYEQPGVWTLEVDLDKRVMAEIVASLARLRVLEFGCANGGVLVGLDRRGLDCLGVDISRMALEAAPAEVRSRIRLGDLLSLDLDQDFDTAFGLDIFEHLNPNRLHLYIRRLKSCLTEGALLFANIPAFGRDEIFGEPFPARLPGWDEDTATARPFRRLQVDELGYPLHGHLIWADTTWWVEQFEAEGFVRCPEIERALHDKYDWYFHDASPGRLSFYVFSAGERPDREAVASEIRRIPSTELEGYPPAGE